MNTYSDFRVTFQDSLIQYTFSLLFKMLMSKLWGYITGFKPALEGRAIINLQMNNTFGAYHDITASIEVGPSAELYTNRGVIHQVLFSKMKS